MRGRRTGTVSSCLAVAAGFLQAVAGGCFAQALPEIGPDVYVRCERSPQFSDDLQRRAIRVVVPRQATVRKQKLIATLKGELSKRGILDTGDKAGPEQPVLMDVVLEKREESIPDVAIMPGGARKLHAGKYGLSFASERTWQAIPTERKVFFSDLDIWATEDRLHNIWEGRASIGGYDTIAKDPRYFIALLLDHYGREADGRVYSPAARAAAEARKEANRASASQGRIFVVLIAIVGGLAIWSYSNK